MQDLIIACEAAMNDAHFKLDYFSGRFLQKIHIYLTNPNRGVINDVIYKLEFLELVYVKSYPTWNLLNVFCKCFRKYIEDIKE